MQIFYVLFLLQAFSFLVLCFGDIGFDKPGKYGLSFNHYIAFLLLYSISVLVGLVLAFKRRRYRLIGVQLLPIFSVCAYLLLPDPRFDAAQYQFLVGKTKAELTRAIGNPRGALTGFQGGPGMPDEGFVDLKGMTVFLSREGIVLRVEPNER